MFDASAVSGGDSVYVESSMYIYIYIYREREREREREEETGRRGDALAITGGARDPKLVPA